jgi:hypothetical protein
VTRATAPDRRRAFLVRTRPLPTFRVRSASGEPSHLVVLQSDGHLLCNCTAASFHAACAHQRIAARSIERRTRARLVAGEWEGQPRIRARGRTLGIIVGGRA